MSPPNPQQQRTRNTPRKGRPRRDSTQSPQNVRPGKNYASENDIPRDSTSVRTPMRGAPGAANSFSGARGNAGHNSQRGRNKGRPTSIATAGSPVGSPASLRADRTSPPLTAGKSAPAAYAGAAFHASPAASALPIPSFMKRTDSPTTGPSPKPSNFGQEPSPPSSDSEAPTPPTRSTQPKDKEPVQESPLDFFFRKDREERLRSGRSGHSSRAHSAQGIAVSSSSFSPPDQSPFGHSGTGRSFNQPTGIRTSLHHRSATSGISPEELDGAPGGPIGPKFSTPFHDRIRAARENSSSGQSTPNLAKRSPGDGTHVLKSILNIADQPSILAAHNGSPSPRPFSFASPSHFAPAYHAGSPAGPHTAIQDLATGGQVGSTPDSIAMANTLKNLLKIQ